MTARSAYAVMCALGVTLADVTTSIPALAQPPGPQDTTVHIVPARGDSVMIHLVDVDLRAAVTALAPYLDRPGPLWRHSIPSV